MSISIPTAFKSKIGLPYGKLQSILEWCKRNCTHEWKFEEDGNTMDTWEPKYTFYFESERDYVAFTLWKK
jgi:hypothetical protein